MLPHYARALALAGVALTLIQATGCASQNPEPDAQSPEFGALMRDAMNVAVAIDVTSRALPKYTAETLDKAGVTLADGHTVRDYLDAFGNGPDPAGQAHYQFCVSDDDGNWVTYGDSTGVQDYGTGPTAEHPRCQFTGKPHVEAAFDVRLLAEAAFDSPDPETDDDTWGNDPAMKAFIEDRLPDGWATSDVDQRGYTGWQFCLTAPDAAEWYYVHSGSVEKYGDTGACRLDPHMEPGN